ncbi:T-kininogen 1-like [Engystomops pustulosus]|uniref:T-kininogen 1-like n=1 Tax=Engystomops pustulosus TaxID=76066 RepID=UPI003AFAAE6D
MRLLTILLFMSHYLLGSATLIDADCNDQNVFSAVDEALRSFNNAKEDGNQFILYRITDAKQKYEEDGHIHNFVEYETHESSCEVKSGKSWQECPSTYVHQAKCSAHVLFKELEFQSVESQNCSLPEAIAWPPPVTVVHHQCLGCPQPIDKENKELLCFVDSTIEQVNTDANHSYYFDLESIVNATRQVVYGWNYNIQFLIKQTNCSKSDFTSKNHNECKMDKEGESFECVAQVYVRPDGSIEYPFIECKSQTGFCINCPMYIEPDDPELQTLLVQVVDEYNFNSNHTELYKVAFVDKAIKKGFLRELHEIHFTVGPTNCSKPHYSILGDECVVNQTSSRLYCKTKIKVTDKTINVHSSPHCATHTVAYSVRIGGWGPLRSSRRNNHEENNRSGILKPVKRTFPLEQGQHNNKGHKHGKKGKKEKEGKKKQKHHQDSSEEEDNENEVTQTPVLPTKPITQKPENMQTDQQAPGLSHNQDISPNTYEISEVNFPGLPTDVPRCPGRVWQPISISPSIPTPGTFTIDDLALAVEDLKPPLDQNIEKNEPPLPKQNVNFNDEDLFG